MDYSVTNLDLDRNRDDIARLLEGNFPDLPQERYDWIYLRNPQGKALSWAVLESTSGALVGTTSLFPRKMNVDGKTVRAGIAGDFAVNREHRGSTAAIRLQRAVVTGMNQSEFEFIYGISNKKAEPVQLRVGYVLLGKMDRWAKLLRTRKYFKASVLRWLVSRPLDLMMKHLSKEKRYQRPEGYTIEKSTSFDQRFDLLWKRASRQFNLIGERSKDYLNWRYGQSPHEGYQIFSLLHKNEQEILGYVIYYLKGKVGVIADMLFLNFDSALESLLSEFIHYLREQDVESISILLFGCPSLEKKLKSFDFVRRDEESRILVYPAKNSPNAEFVLNTENWFLLEGDRDI